jgi:hypothetical protein
MSTLKALAKLTLCEFEPADFEPAQRLCAQLGYRDSFAYATSSDLPGLYCLPPHSTQRGAVICKSAEFGLIAIQTFED